MRKASSTDHATAAVQRTSATAILPTAIDSVNLLKAESIRMNIAGDLKVASGKSPIDGKWMEAAKHVSTESAVMTAVTQLVPLADPGSTHTALSPIRDPIESSSPISAAVRFEAATPDNWKFNNIGPQAAEHTQGEFEADLTAHQLREKTYQGSTRDAVGDSAVTSLGA